MLLTLLWDFPFKFCCVKKNTNKRYFHVSHKMKNIWSLKYRAFSRNLFHNGKWLSIFFFSLRCSTILKSILFLFWVEFPLYSDVIFWENRYEIYVASVVCMMENGRVINYIWFDFLWLCYKTALLNFCISIFTLLFEKKIKLVYKHDYSFT